MTETQAHLLRKAKDSLHAAQLLLDGGHPGFAASRAYYAMFYVAKAFLESHGLGFSKHSAVIAAFGQHFAHTGKVPVEFHRYLIDAEDVRLGGDYEPLDTVAPEQAAEQIEKAELFLQLAEQLIGPIPPEETIAPPSPPTDPNNT